MIRRRQSSVRQLWGALTCAGLLAVALAKVAACSTNPSDKAKKGQFSHGVASGDPDQASVVLWTRYVAYDSTAVSLQWAVAEDSSFSQVVQRGTAQASPSNDFCVKVIASDLASGTEYYYRFHSRSSRSEVGRTKTLPEQTEHVRIGVVNCAKYTGGYYHAYETLARLEDIDVVIHLGDYIYENGPSTEESSYWPAYLATGRQHDPPHECLSLQDYRTRYAQYRGDTALQKLHARYPMIPIWDDHEIAMKALKPLPDGTLEYDGDWEGRKNNSIQAYHEWLPIRVAAGEPIYRSFQFGDLVNLMMLDARVCCKDTVTKTLASLEDTSRHIVGKAQLDWIESEVLRHGATWNIFGNQLLLSIKDMGWERWPGFPADRNRLLAFMEEQTNANFLFATGNAHNPHHYFIMNAAGTDTLLHEVLPGAISSGNNAEKARYDPDVLAKSAERLDNMDNLLWYHQDSHGFIVLDVGREELQVDWYFVSSIREKDYTVERPYGIRIGAR